MTTTQTKPESKTDENPEVLTEAEIDNTDEEDEIEPQEPVVTAESMLVDEVAELEKKLARIKARQVFAQHTDKVIAFLNQAIESGDLEMDLDSYQLDRIFWDGGTKTFKYGQVLTPQEPNKSPKVMTGEEASKRAPRQAILTIDGKEAPMNSKKTGNDRQAIYEKFRIEKPKSELSTQGLKELLESKGHTVIKGYLNGS